MGGNGSLSTTRGPTLSVLVRSNAMPAGTPIAQLTAATRGLLLLLSKTLQKVWAAFCTKCQGACQSVCLRLQLLPVIESTHCLGLQTGSCPKKKKKKEREQPHPAGNPLSLLAMQSQRFLWVRMHQRTPSVRANLSACLQKHLSACMHA